MPIGAALAWDDDHCEVTVISAGKAPIWWPGYAAGSGRADSRRGSARRMELAGEIKAAWPEKSVTIVDPARDILSGAYPEEFRAGLRSHLGPPGATLGPGQTLAP